MFDPRPLLIWALKEKILRFDYLAVKSFQV